MAYKKLKRVKKKEKLPSFLLKSPEVPENVSFPPKTTKSVHHLGPIFFGCHEYQPMIHRLNLSHTQELHKTASSTENILRDAFLPKPLFEKYIDEHKIQFPATKAKVPFLDTYPHKCPGMRRVFAPESPPVVDFGQTQSTIEGETSMEIPLCRCWKSADGTIEEYEFIEPSDLWETKRIYMSSIERMAHTHFPKQFVTVQVIGPPIPASITIRKLPSKRKTDSQLDLELNIKTKKKKGAESNAKTEKRTEHITEEQPSEPEPESVPSTEQQPLGIVTSDAVVEDAESNERTSSEKLHSEHDIMQADEEADEEAEAQEDEEEDDTNVMEAEATEEAPAEGDPEN